MADHVTITAGSGTSIATDDVGGVHYQRVKLVESTADSSTETGVSGNPLRVDPTGSTAQPVTDNGGTLSVDDGAGSLTVDGTVTAVGGAATDAPVSGNPVLAAGRASNAIPSAVSADGDVVPVWLERTGAVVVTPRFGATSTLSNVSASASSVTLLASNTARRSVTIVNDSSALLMVKEGATASATSYSWLLQAYDTLVLDGSYSGVIDGIWASATGAARITERT